MGALSRLGQRGCRRGTNLSTKNFFKFLAFRELRAVRKSSHVSDNQSSPYDLHYHVRWIYILVDGRGLGGCHSGWRISAWHDTHC